MNSCLILACGVLAIVAVHSRAEQGRDPFVEQIRQVDPAIYKWYRDTYWENCGLLETIPRTTPEPSPSRDYATDPTNNNGRSDQATQTNGAEKHNVSPAPPVTQRPIIASTIAPPRPTYDNGNTGYRPSIETNETQARLNTQGLSISFPSEDEEAHNIARQDFVNAQLLRQRGYAPYNPNNYYQTGSEVYYNGQNQQQRGFAPGNNHHVYQNSYPSGNSFNGGYPARNGNYAYQNGHQPVAQPVTYRRRTSNAPQVITLSNGDVLIIERGKRDASYVAESSNQINSGIGRLNGFRSRQRRESTSRPIVVGVVGGRDATKIYPWMVPIVAKGFEDGKYIIWCGASLVTDRHLVTAAHCFDIRRDPTTFSALIRAHNLSKPDSVEDLVKITLHPEYQPGKFYNDVAIVTLAKPVPNFKPICLPIEDPVGVDEPAAPVEVLGYGSLAFGEHASDTLQTAGLEVFANEDCRANYSSKQDTALPQGIIKTHLCAGARDGAKDACQNDSGGPLVNGDRYGRKLLVGVVSFGYQCAREGYPGVYSRVKEFLPWILPTIRQR